MRSAVTGSNGKYRIFPPPSNLQVFTPESVLQVAIRQLRDLLTTQPVLHQHGQMARRRISFEVQPCGAARNSFAWSSPSAGVLPLLASTGAA